MWFEITSDLFRHHGICDSHHYFVCFCCFMGDIMSPHLDQLLFLCLMFYWLVLYLGATVFFFFLNVGL